MHKYHYRSLLLTNNILQVVQSAVPHVLQLVVAQVVLQTTITLLLILHAILVALERTPSVAKFTCVLLVVTVIS